MASEALYQELAKALSRPSKAYRATQAALNVPQQALEGYLQGGQVADTIRKRNLGQQTLEQALGGNIPKGLEGFGGTTVQAAEELSKPIDAIASLVKANREGTKPEDVYTPAQTEAVASGDPRKLAAAFGGKVPRTAVAANTTARGVSGKNDFFGARTGQIGLQQLPSQLGPSTAAGAAYQVKVAAQQGKTLIASPGAYQRLGLAQGDAARAILRNSPTDEAMRNANFSDTLINKYNAVKQRITSDPSAIDQPEIRKTFYDIFDEMDKSATPFISNHLQNMEANGTNSSFGTNWGGVKRRELGLDLPSAPFNAGGISGASTGDPEADAAIQTIQSSNLPDSAKAIRVRAIQERIKRP